VDGSLWMELSRILYLMFVSCGAIQRPVWPNCRRMLIFVLCTAEFGSKMHATGVGNVAARDGPTLLSVAGSAVAVRACASVVRCGRWL